MLSGSRGASVLVSLGLLGAACRAGFDVDDSGGSESGPGTSSGSSSDAGGGGTTADDDTGSGTSSDGSTSGSSTTTLDGDSTTTTTDDSGDGSTTTSGADTTSAGTTGTTTGSGTTSSTTTSGTGGGCAPGTGHRVFVSSIPVTGNLGGLAGGDGVCQLLASNAGLGGQWLAILSDATTDARDRICVTGDVYLANDGVGAPNDTLVQLGALFWGATHAVTIDRDETGQMVPSSFVWTGTDVGGTAVSDHCDSWRDGTGGFNGWVGATAWANQNWVSQTTNGCALTSRLYCISQ